MIAITAGREGLPLAITTPLQIPVFGASAPSDSLFRFVPIEESLGTGEGSQRGFVADDQRSAA